MEDNNVLDIKIAALREEWEKQISHYLKSEDGLNLNCLHSIILELIVEIKENGLRNKENNNFFLRSINKIIEKDPTLNKHLGTYVSFIKHNISKDRNNYVLESCYSIISFFKKTLYFEDLINQLNILLSDNIELDIDFYTKLKSNVNSIICELILKGYTMSDAEKIISDIFDNYDLSDTGLFTSKYPELEFRFKTFDLSSESDVNKLEILKNQINSLTITDRISALKSYINNEAKKCIFIFPVVGIKSTDDFKFYEVDFFNKLDKYLTDKKLLNKLLNFKKSKKDKYSYINAAVPCTYLSPKSSFRACLGIMFCPLDEFVAA